MTLELIEGLLLQLSSPFATNSSGEPVLNDKMVTIWEEEKKHMKCIQGPDGIICYTSTGHFTKSGVELPVFGMHVGPPHWSRFTSTRQGMQM